MPHKMIFALAALALLAAQPAHADPMKCSGEQKTCTTKCVGLAGALLSNCTETCRTILKGCIRTGCWDNGKNRYCGLMKQ